MDTILSALLVLVLASDDAAMPVAQELGQLLQQEHGERLDLQVGLPAIARLQQFGVGVEDLLADPHLAQQLSKQEPIALIHVDKRISGEDTVLTAQLWFGGTSEHFVAIAGPEGDPTPDLLNGVARLLRGFLEPEADGQRLAIGPQVSLATLVEREAWQPMLGLLASKEDKNPREWYYMVVAYVRLKQRNAAVASLAEFREAHGKHFLVDAAAALIPPPQAAQAELEAMDRRDLTPPEAPEPPPNSPRARYDLTEEVITPTPPEQTEHQADADEQP